MFPAYRRCAVAMAYTGEDINDCRGTMAPSFRQRLMMNLLACGAGACRRAGIGDILRIMEGSVDAHGDGDGTNVSIAIVDNDAITLYALRMIVSRMPGVRMAWETMTGREAFVRCVEDDDPPGVLLVDMGLTDMPGPLLCRLIRTHSPWPPMLAITSYPIELYASDAAEAGVQGIIGKKDMRDLRRAIRVVGCGGTAPSRAAPDVRFDDAGAAFQRIRRAPAEPAATLTWPEMEVLNLSAQGLNLNEIARRLGVQPSTARSHARHARIKLNARTLGEALVKWNQAKWR